MIKGIVLACSFLVFSTILLSACSPPAPPPAPTYFNITTVQLDEMLKNKDFLLVNVHIPYEGEIPGTDLFVPFDEIEQNLSKFPADKGAKIVLYCRSGRMSAEAAADMVDLGFTNVWNVMGGMVAWGKEGNELIHK